MCTLPDKLSDGVHLGAGVPRETSSRRGFTLLELLVVLVMIGFTMGIVAPRFTEYRTRWELESAAQQLVGDIHRARIEAFKRNQVVWVAVSSSSAYAMRFLGARELPEATTFGAGISDTVRFTPYGPTLTGPVDFGLEHRGRSVVVRVDAAGGTQIVRP